MALKNANLQKVGTAVSTGNANGDSQMQLVQSANPLPDPGGFDGTSTWHHRHAEWSQSVQVTQKFSQDWE